LIGLALLTTIPSSGKAAELVKDINTVAQSIGTYSRGFVELGGEHYFFAGDGISGHELWKTDGTEIGTQMVVDICPGACDASFQGNIINLDGTLIFGAWAGINGTELWSSDGTEVGTVRDRNLLSHTIERTTHTEPKSPMKTAV